jgi:NAD(P)-dependent dehydrogenase (short-subunit alcohol dehydrogenase family)
MRSVESPRVVVVTGGSAGVGRATAVEFARHGAAVGVIARGIEGLESTQEQLVRMGVPALGVSADVAQFDELERAVDRIEAKLGPIDAWVNNAMTTVFAPVAQMSSEEFRRVTEVTYLGSVFGTLAVLPRMRQRGRGTIVQVGSSLAYLSIPLQSAYCGSKHAVRGFVDSLRCELMHDGSPIHLSIVELPALNTPQFSWCRTHMVHHPKPWPPVFQPEVAARAIVWAASHHPRELKVGGSTAWTIWLNKLFPGVIDRYLASRGYERQQTRLVVPIDRPDNLWAPAPIPHSAHGPFDATARPRAGPIWEWLHRS